VEASEWISIPPPSYPTQDNHYFLGLGPGWHCYHEGSWPSWTPSKKGGRPWQWRPLSSPPECRLSRCKAPSSKSGAFCCGLGPCTDTCASHTQHEYRNRRIHILVSEFLSSNGRVAHWSRKIWRHVSRARHGTFLDIWTWRPQAPPTTPDESLMLG
jgi:hypothetical protein